MLKSSLTALGREQLKLAKGSSNGRSASTVYGGHEHVLRQTVIALLSGEKLSEHENPGEASTSCSGASASARRTTPGKARPATCSSSQTPGTTSKLWRTPSYC